MSSVEPRVRFFAVGLAMLLAAIFALVLKPTQKVSEADKPRLEAIVPESFGDWKIDPTVVQVVPSPGAQSVLEKVYDQLISRTYVNGAGERMMLTIAYGGDQSEALRSHRQEVCYSAQGFAIQDLTRATMDFGQTRIPVIRMLAIRGPRSEPVTYWMTMGNRVVVGRLDRFATQLRYGLAGRIPDGFLVRISNLSTDEATAFKSQQDFMTSLFGSMRPPDVSLLIGNMNS